MIGQALPSHSTKEQSISDQHDAIFISSERPKLIPLLLEYLAGRLPYTMNCYLCWAH